MNRLTVEYARPPHVWLARLWGCVLCVLALAVAWSAGRTAFAIQPAPIVVLKHFESIPEMIVQESSRAGISAHLPLAIAWRESRLTNVLSKTLDAGPLQVNLLTARNAGFDPTTLLDARNSIIVGIQWLVGYQKRCGSDRAAVAAYARGRCPSN